MGGSQFFFEGMQNDTCDCEICYLIIDELSSCTIYLEDYKCLMVLASTTIFLVKCDIHL
jgi:hypothetical protein